MSYGHEMVSGKEKNWTRQLKRCSNFYRIQLKLYGISVSHHVYTIQKTRRPERYTKDRFLPQSLTTFLD